MTTLDPIQEAFAKLSLTQRWQVIHDLLRAMLGDDPQDETPVNDSEGVTYAFVVPAWKRFELVERSPEEWSALEASLLKQNNDPPRADEGAGRHEHVGPSRR
jgi:hypothetical protein